MGEAKLFVLKILVPMHRDLRPKSMTDREQLLTFQNKLFQ